MTTATAPRKKLEITLSRVFDAPRNLVFRMWTEDEHRKEWVCPHGLKFISGENEPRIGGKWNCDMQSQDGVLHLERGVYREIVDQERLILAHGWLDENTGKPGPETLVTVTFIDEGAGTRMTFHQAGFASIESRDGHEEGWGESFEKLADHLAAVISSNADNREIVITRIIDAPRERIFKAWTDPEQMKQWWGPHGFTSPVCELDLKPGGAFNVVMRGPDGTEYPCPGVFLEITAPERLIFTDAFLAGWKPSKEAFITTFLTLEDAHGKTKHTLRVLHWSAAGREKHEKMGFCQGWNQSLDRLAALVTK